MSTMTAACKRAHFVIIPESFMYNSSAQDHKANRRLCFLSLFDIGDFYSLNAFNWPGHSLRKWSLSAVISVTLKYCHTTIWLCVVCLLNLSLCSHNHLIPQMMYAATQLVSSWAWIREYSRPPLKGSRKRLLLVNKHSSKPCLLEVF